MAALQGMHKEVGAQRQCGHDLVLLAGQTLQGTHHIVEKDRCRVRSE